MTTALADPPAQVKAPMAPAASAPAPAPPAFVIAARRRNGVGVTLELIPTSNDPLGDEAARDVAGARRARQALADVRAAFLQTAAVQELNTLRKRASHIDDNFRDAKTRADSARRERTAAIALGDDDQLDAIDARLSAAESDVAKFTARSGELRGMINTAEANAKAALAERLTEAIVSHGASAAAAIPLAEQRLGAALSAALNELLEAQAAVDSAYRLRRSNRDEFLTV